MEKVMNFFENLIEEKKVEYARLAGSLSYDKMVEDIKSLNLPADKMEELLKIVEKYKK